MTDFILVHGLGRGPMAWLLLAWRLRRAGHRPHLYYYVAALEKFDPCAARLQRFIARKCGNLPYAVVGHSLGTVLLRTVLPRLERPPVSITFLAPPVVACRFARWMNHRWLFRLLTGEMGQKLGDAAFMAGLPVPANCAVFAGNGGPRWRHWPCGAEPNDGILMVSETQLPGAEYHTLPAIHTFIMNRPEVAEAVINTVPNASGAHRKV